MNKKTKTGEILQNVITGLAVSFVALSLGAALGILSGRGAFAGMISAGIIAFLTGILGGTRVQCSGPTAPMSAVSAFIVAFAYDGHLNSIAEFQPDHFINIVFIMTGLFLLVMGVMRLGRFITLVPNVVISGFMSGIAVLIWVGQVEKLFGFGGKTAYSGSIYLNVIVTLATLFIILALPSLLRKTVPKAATFIPATLIAIIVVSVLTNMFGLSIEHVEITSTIHNVDDFTNLLSEQWPKNWSSEILKEALPFALQLAILCYLDTLLTSLVVDKMSKEKTKQNKELIAQGAANATIALVGGIPGAQATIRSVLMLKEGATMRIAGILVGIFVLVELLVFQNIIRYIPQSVFAGILFKVGYDVFDFLPIRLYLHELLKGKVAVTENIFRRHAKEKIFVTNLEMVFILGTIIVTVFYDLNAAVVSFTLLFYLISRFTKIRDLKVEQETKIFMERS